MRETAKQNTPTPAATPAEGSARPAGDRQESSALNTALTGSSAMRALCAAGMLSAASPAPSAGLEESRWLSPNSHTIAITQPPAIAQPSSLAARVSELKASGFDLTMKAGFTAGVEQDRLNAANALNRQGKFEVGASRDPLAQLNFVVGADCELPPELRSNSKINVYPLQLESKPISDQKGIIVLRNSLDPKQPAFYQTEVALGADGRMAAQEESRVEREFLARYRGGREELRAQFGAIADSPAAAVPQAVSLDRAGALSPAEVAQVNQVLDQGFRLSVNYVPDQRPVDRAIGSDVLVKDYQFALTPQTLAKLDGARIAVSGDISEISMARDIPIDSIARQEGTNDPQTVNGRLATEVQVDRFGNRITRHVMPLVGDKSGVESFVIQPPLISSKEQNPAPVPLSVDLSGFGLGQLPPLMSRTPHRQLPDVGGRTVVTNMAPEQVDAETTGRLAQVGEGMTRAEELFGAQPRSLAKQIALLNSENPNASYNPTNPTTVVIQDEVLRTAIAADLVGLHETAHLIDGSTDYRLSGGQFRTQYEKLREAQSPFLSTINERNFIPNTALGGHAEANHLELFASLINSVDYAGRDRAGWEQRVGTLSPEVRQDYRDTLAALLETLNAEQGQDGQGRFGRAPLVTRARELMKSLED